MHRPFSLPLFAEVEAAASLGLASNPAPGDYYDANNALHVGLGLRAGVILFGGFYGGAKVVDYLGSTTTTFGSGIPIEEHALQEGLELGWDFKLFGRLSLRPQIGVGNITFSGTANSPYVTPEGFLRGTNRASSGSSFYLEPELTALVSFGPLIVGADVSYSRFRTTRTTRRRSARTPSPRTYRSVCGSASAESTRHRPRIPRIVSR
jgi:hypothetical protein